MLKRLRRLGDESGQSIVTIGLMSFFILGLLGVVADTGFTWIQRRNLQNAADSAALAAAQNLPEDRTTAETKARDYAKANIGGITDADIDVCFEDTCSAEAKPLSVRVTVRKKSESLFGVSLGFGQLNVSAKARAKVRSAQVPGPGVNPIGISEFDFKNAGTGVIPLKDPGGSGTTGNYGLIAFCNPDDKSLKCSGKPVVDEGLLGGSAGVWDPGTESETGAKSAIRDSVIDRMAAAKANNCYTLTQVLDSATGKLKDACNPLIGSRRGSLAGYPDIQPTSVVLIPVITDATWDPKGSKPVGLLMDSSGQRIFAFFAIDPTSVEKIAGVGPTCLKSQCDLRGVFVQALHAALGASGQALGDYTDETVVKVVQLVE